MSDSAAPTRELFERVPRDSLKNSCCQLVWCTSSKRPAVEFGDITIALDTVGKLRAACLLLDIPWPDA